MGLTKSQLRTYFHSTVKEQCIFTPDNLVSLTTRLDAIVWDTKIVLCYFPNSREPPLLNYFVTLHQQWKTTLMPINSRKNVSVWVWDWTSLSSSRWLTEVTKPREWEIDIAILPWLLFDAHWTRLGHGWGWYDQLFGHYSKIKKIGVCHYAQYVDTMTLPKECHDITIDIVLK